MLVASTLGLHSLQAPPPPHLCLPHTPLAPLCRACWRTSLMPSPARWWCCTRARTTPQASTPPLTSGGEAGAARVVWRASCRPGGLLHHPPPTPPPHTYTHTPLSLHCPCHTPPQVHPGRGAAAWPAALLRLRVPGGSGRPVMPLIALPTLCPPLATTMAHPPPPPTHTQGFASGDLDADAFAIRLFSAAIDPKTGGAQEMLLAQVLYLVFLFVVSKVACISMLFIFFAPSFCGSRCA